MNKVISTLDRLFMSIVGPSGSGKTDLIFKMLTSKTFYPNFETIIYFYQHEQPKYRDMEKKLNIEFKKFNGFELISCDDSCEDLFNDKEFSKLATAGRHKKLSVIFVKHNLFQQGKWSRTIDLNTSHIVLFKSPRDIQQISFIGRQIDNTNFLKTS